MMKALMVCLLVCGVSTLCWAETTYYVAPNGSDSSSGSLDRPFATIQQAADLVNPGDTVIVRDGVYTNSHASNSEATVQVHIDRGGTAAQPITFRSEHKWGAVLDGQDRTVTNGWDFWGNAAYIIVEDFEVRGFRNGGFWSNTSGPPNANHITIRGNHIHHCGGGLFSGQFVNYITFDRNLVHDISHVPGYPITDEGDLDHVIYFCGQHLAFTNNILRKCEAAWGIQLGRHTDHTPAGAVDVLISNNTIAYGAWGAIVLEGRCADLTIQNNIFYQWGWWKERKPNAINFWCGSEGVVNLLVRNNLSCGGGVAASNNLLNGEPVSYASMNNIENQDPRFVAPKKYDFRLTSGSPAINAGIGEQAPKTDMEGKPRPQGRGCDIGAYER